MDLDLKHLQRIESGVINVTLETLMRIANGLELSIRDLFDDVSRSALSVHTVPTASFPYVSTSSVSIDRVLINRLKKHD